MPFSELRVTQNLFASARRCRPCGMEPSGGLSEATLGMLCTKENVESQKGQAHLRRDIPYDPLHQACLLPALRHDLPFGDSTMKDLDPPTRYSGEYECKPAIRCSCPAFLMAGEATTPVWCAQSSHFRRTNWRGNPPKHCDPLGRLAGTLLWGASTGSCA